MVANHDGPNTVCLTQVNDVPLVHVLDALADLPHVVDDLGLAHGVALTGDLFEQLAPGQAGIVARHHTVHQTRAANALFHDGEEEGERENKNLLQGGIFSVSLISICSKPRRYLKDLHQLSPSVAFCLSFPSPHLRN